MRRTIKVQIVTHRGQSRFIWVDIKSPTTDGLDRVLKRLKTKYRMKVRPIDA